MNLILQVERAKTKTEKYQEQNRNIFSVEKKFVFTFDIFRFDRPHPVDSTIYRVAIRSCCMF